MGRLGFQGALGPEWPPSSATVLGDNPRLGPKPLCPGLSACPPAPDLPRKTLGKSPALLPDSLGAAGGWQQPAASAEAQPRAVPGTPGLAWFGGPWATVPRGPNPGGLR